MRIIIDGRMIGWTGIGRYTKHLLLQLEQQDTTTEFIVLLQTGDIPIWQPKAANFRTQIVNIAPYSVQEQIKLPGILRSLKPDLVHFPHFTVPLFYRDPFVVTVHDMTLVDYKNYHSGVASRITYELKYVVSRIVLRHAVKQARIVMSPTNFVRDRLTTHFHLAPEHFTTIPLGCDPLTPSTKPPAPASPIPYLFNLGNSYPYKNLNRLVDAFADSSFKSNGGQLVLTGPEDYFRDQLRRYVVKHKLESSVKLLGRVSDSALVALYQQATLYIQPSLSEGFGLPGLEAMAYNAPVLSADSSCLPEVYGDAAAYFDATSTSDLTKHIDALVIDSYALSKLAENGQKRLLHFNWKTTGEQTLAVYRVALRTNEA